MFVSPWNKVFGFLQNISLCPLGIHQEDVPNCRNLAELIGNKRMEILCCRFCWGQQLRTQHWWPLECAADVRAERTELQEPESPVLKTVLTLVDKTASKWVVGF